MKIFAKAVTEIPTRIYTGTVQESNATYYSDDPDDFNEEPEKRKLPAIFGALLLLVGGAFFVQTTLAANISLNTGSPIEFGQGTLQTVACSGANSLMITPNSSFTNESGGGAYHFSSVKVSNIPETCYGKDFIINAYGNADSAPLALFNSTSKNVIVYNNAGTFEPGIGGIGMSVTSESEGFTATFFSPAALSSSVFKISIQSSDASLSVVGQSVSAGISHICVLLNSGAPKCWGSDYNGQLGDNTYQSHSTPYTVYGLSSGVVGITAGGAHTCALLGSGAVKCWGYNVYGQIGDGTTTDRTTPTAVSGLSSGVTAIAVGSSNTCALLDTGAVKCWGGNLFGKLGDGTTTDRKTPTAVSGLSSGVVGITAGGYHNCALLGSGAVKCWGYNGAGSLGDGTTTNRSLPTTVNGLISGAVAIAAGDYSTCAILNSGAVQCWGYVSDGSLGDGINTTSNTPVSVKFR